MASVGSSSKPPPRLSPTEEELRDCLLRAAAAAQRILGSAGRPGRQTLQDWVSRRMPGELILRVNSSGKVELTTPALDIPDSRGTAKSEGKATPRPPAPPERNASKGKDGKGLPQPQGKGTGVDDVKARARAVDVQAFLAGLPTDSFLSAEEKLREVLLLALAAGPLSVTKVMSDRQVAAAAMALLPNQQGAIAVVLQGQLQAWIDNRIGGEVKVYEKDGQTMCKLAQEQEVAETIAIPDEPVSRDDFFAGLPADSFSEGEEALRLALYTFLAQWPSKVLANLSNAGANKGVAMARSGFLPASVSLRDWIEQRIGVEVTLDKDSKGQFVLNLSAPARAMVASIYKKLGVAAKVQSPSIPVNATAKAASAKAAFLATLPADELTDKELRLRQALLDFIARVSSTSGRAATVSDVTNHPSLKTPQAELLPRDVPLQVWIEERIGEEIELRQDGPPGQVALVVRQASANASSPEIGATPAVASAPAPVDRRVAQAGAADEEMARRSAAADRRVAQAGAVEEELARRARQLAEAQEAKSLSGTAAAAASRKGAGKRPGEVPDAVAANPAEVAARRDAFFAGLPEDSFTAAEEELREALLSYLQTRHGTGSSAAPPLLANASKDTRVNNAGKVLLARSGAKLRDWVDTRIGGEVETKTWEHGEVAFALLGELAKYESSAQGGGQKRKAESLGASAATAGSKGKGKHSKGVSQRRSW